MPIYTKPHAETIEKAPPIDFRSAKGLSLTSYTAKGNMTQAAEQQYTLSGIPPLSFSAKGTPLTSYSVTGAMTQTGTPTPDAPIVPEECGDLVTTGEHAGEYEIPITVSGTTYPVYLSEPLRKIGDYADSVDSSGAVTRRIYKYAFTGEEPVEYVSGSGAPLKVQAPYYKRPAYDECTWLCTHYRAIAAAASWSGDNFVSMSFNDTPDRFYRFKDTRFTDDAEGFKAYLAAQYANGTPVCIWYVRTTATTESITCPTITPASGSNTLSVGTVLAPSGVSITTVGGVAPYNPIQPEECGELVESGEHAGQYKLTFTNAGNSYPVYLQEPLRKIGDYADELSSAGTVTRRIKKLVLTGTENYWQSTSNNIFYGTFITDYLQAAEITCVCTHYESQSNPSGTSGVQDMHVCFRSSGATQIYIRDSSIADLAAFKAFLAGEITAGHPVTVWYALSAPTTETITAPEIATAKGDNTFTETSTLKPSAVSISVPDLYQSITKIPVGDGTNEALKVYANDGRMVYDIRADVARQMAKQFDGTAATYKSVMQSFFSLYNANSISSANLTDLCRAWYKGTRDSWNGWTTFSSTSGASSGTRGGDNSGLTCVPSTNDTAGQDDFAGLPLFYPIDVNYEVDADTKDIIITGIDGITSSFDRYDPDKFVGVMQMSAYVWHSEDAVNETFTDGYSAQPVTTADSCWMLPEAVRMDGTVREFVVHPKYMGTVVNGKLKCYSGVTPSAYVISHNTVNSYGKANGNQYSGGSVTLLGFLEIMTRIKYASLTQDGIIQGCLDYNVQSPVAAATTSKQYVLLSAANAAKYIVGSTVLIGTATGTSAPDRGAASAYSVTGQAGTVVTKITDDPDGSANKAVWFEELTAFDATGSGSYASGVTVISTFAWQNGSCDSVLGNDGSAASPSGGKYPAMIQGIEYSVGIYEVYGDMLMQANPATTDYPLGYYSFFVCKDASKRSTDVTANYTELPAKLPYVTNTTAAWRYIKTMSWSNGIIVPTDCNGGSSTTYTRDAFYFMATPSSKTTRERLCFGYLANGVGGGGLSSSLGSNAPSNASWIIGGRPSCVEAFRA